MEKISFLKCENLSIGYGSKVVQENLNFCVEQGDYFFILGENGSGKTTLMKTVLGFIKPLCGKIIYLNSWNKHGVGFLPQQTEIQKTFPATVREIVLSGCQENLRLFPFYRKSDIAKAELNMEKLGILELEKCSFKELSGGQQQRVLLARALCAAKSFLFLDEPTKGFDSQITLEMYELFFDLNKNGMTIITISHDIESAKKYGNKVLKLEKMEKA
ncbi:MAG: metal ABC transporter ATP-binding protein [Treponemataceae bacterium]